MPLKRLLEHFMGTLSWALSHNFSGLYMDMPKIRPSGTNPKRIDRKTP